MKILKLVLTMLAGVAGTLSAVSGAIATKYWFITVVVLSILKLAGLTTIPWFAGLTTASAIGTGLWMLLGGIFFFFIGLWITIISAIILNNKWIN